MFIRRQNADPALVVREFQDYGSAALASNDTYDHAVISEIVVENTKSILLQHEFQLNPGEGEHIFLAVQIAARNAKSAVRVLDFGGAAGLHATVSIRTLADIDQRWAIVETPSMVEACTGLSTEKIQFFQTIEDALNWLGEADLVLSSETLHYMPDPFAAVKDLRSIGAQTLLVQRSALSLGREVVQLEAFRLSELVADEHLGNADENVVQVPVTYVNQDDFVTSLCEGYTIAFAFNGQPYKTVDDTKIEFGSVYLLQKE